MRWFYAISHNEQYLKDLYLQIQYCKEKEFIVLSPFPMLRGNYPRRKASKLYKRLFSELANVSFIDLFNNIPSDEDYFNDIIHLNEKGHRLLAEPVCDAILQIMEANNLAPIRKESDMGQAEYIRHYSDVDCQIDNKLCNCLN